MVSKSISMHYNLTRLLCVLLRTDEFLNILCLLDIYNTAHLLEGCTIAPRSVIKRRYLTALKARASLRANLPSAHNGSPGFYCKQACLFPTVEARYSFPKPFICQTHLEKSHSLMAKLSTTSWGKSRCNLSFFLILVCRTKKDMAFSTLWGSHLCMGHG